MHTFTTLQQFTDYVHPYTDAERAAKQDPAEWLVAVCPSCSHHQATTYRKLKLSKFCRGSATPTCPFKDSMPETMTYWDVCRALLMAPSPSTPLTKYTPSMPLGQRMFVTRCTEQGCGRIACHPIHKAELRLGLTWGITRCAMHTPPDHEVNPRLVPRLVDDIGMDFDTQEYAHAIEDLTQYRWVGRKTQPCFTWGASFTGTCTQGHYVASSVAQMIWWVLSGSPPTLQPCTQCRAQALLDEHLANHRVPKERVLAKEWSTIFDSVHVQYTCAMGHQVWTNRLWCTQCFPLVPAPHARHGTVLVEVARFDYRSEGGHVDKMCKRVDREGWELLYIHRSGIVARSSDHEAPPMGLVFDTVEDWQVPEYEPLMWLSQV
jgi:hypothetical protein